MITISEFVIVARDPRQSARVYRQLFGDRAVSHAADGTQVIRAEKTTVRILQENHARQYLGALPDDYDGSPRMAAISLQVRDLLQLKETLKQGRILFTEMPDAIIVEPRQAFNATLRFHI